MTFENFYEQHPHYSYLVAKIYYNIEKEKQSEKSNFPFELIVQFSAPMGDICESCTA